MRSMRLALVLLTVAIAAPCPLTAQSQAHRNEPAVPAPGKIATATGCLARGVEPNTFVLKNVAWQSSNVSSPGPHGSPSASPTNTPATTETLRLAGAASTPGLDAYVGHTISATGALAKTDPPVTPGIVLPEPQGDTTSRTRAAEEGAASTLRTFDMRSMTDVAPHCR
jgi:hypothetical protein